MSVEKLDLKDPDGAFIDNLINIDGMIVSTYGRNMDVIAKTVRNVKNLNVRDNDVMLCTPAKSGTHWGYEIMHMLLKGKAEQSQIPKIEFMLSRSSEEEMEKYPSPRIFNTHLPYHMLPVQMKAKKTKTILLLRNPKDTAVSFYHHNKGVKLYNYSGKFCHYLQWFMQGNLEFNSWFEYVLGFEKAIDAKEVPIHLVFFEDLKQNSVEEIRKMATFLEVQADDKLCREIAENTNFVKMEERTIYKSEMVQQHMNDGFHLFRKGAVGDWKNYFTVAENKVFDVLYKSKMADSKIQFQYESSKTTCNL